MICKECGIKESLEEVSAFDLIDSFEEDRESKARDYLLSIISNKAIFEYTNGEKVNLNDLDWFDLNEIIYYDDDKIYDKFKMFVISLMTEEEKENEFYENYEGFSEGEFCNF